MSRKKTTTKKTATADNASNALPEGFKSLSSEQGIARDWDAMPELIGEWGGVRTISVKRGRKTEEQRLATVRDEADGVLYTVWESALLTPLFEEAEQGDRVAIKYLGLGKAKPGQNPPRLFNVGIAE